MCFCPTNPYSQPSNVPSLSSQGAAGLLLANMYQTPPHLLLSSHQLYMLRFHPSYQIGYHLKRWMTVMHNFPRPETVIMAG